MYLLSSSRAGRGGPKCAAMGRDGIERRDETETVIDAKMERMMMERPLGRGSESVDWRHRKFCFAQENINMLFSPVDSRGKCLGICLCFITIKVEKKEKQLATPGMKSQGEFTKPRSTQENIVCHCGYIKRPGSWGEKAVIGGKNEPHFNVGTRDKI